VYALFGRDERPQRYNMWACFLLDVHQRLGKREAGVSAVSTKLFGAACPSTERINGQLGVGCVMSLRLSMYEIPLGRRAFVHMHL
jgi:hypothetical protein